MRSVLFQGLGGLPAASRRLPRQKLSSTVECLLRKQREGSGSGGGGKGPKDKESSPRAPGLGPKCLWEGRCGELSCSPSAGRLRDAERGDLASPWGRSLSRPWGRGDTAPTSSKLFRNGGSGLIQGSIVLHRNDVGGAYLHFPDGETEDQVRGVKQQPSLQQLRALSAPCVPGLVLSACSR